MERLPFKNRYNTHSLTEFNYTSSKGLPMIKEAQQIKFRKKRGQGDKKEGYKERENYIAVCRGKNAPRAAHKEDKRQVLNYDQGQLPCFLAHPH